MVKSLIMTQIRGLRVLGMLGARQMQIGCLAAKQPRAVSMINVSQIRTKFNPDNPGLVGARSGIEETDEEFDQRYLNYFNKPDIDGWELRKGINDMQTLDLIPDPEIMKAVFRACRRVNDHSVAIRYQEAVKSKTAGDTKIWEYLKEEFTPTLKELGISSLEEMEYDKPELALGDPSRTPLYEEFQEDQYFKPRTIA